MSDNAISQNAIVIERIFDAPINLIWQMWTDPEHFKQWYGPQGFTIPVAEMDVRIGGKRRIGMESPDGSMKMWFIGEYTEIIPNERLVYTENMADEDGNLTSPPMETEVTIVFEDLDGRTKITMTHAGIPADSPGAIGWEQAFTKLEHHIKSE